MGNNSPSTAFSSKPRDIIYVRCSIGDSPCPVTCSMVVTTSWGTLHHVRNAWYRRLYYMPFVSTYFRPVSIRQTTISLIVTAASRPRTRQSSDAAWQAGNAYTPLRKLWISQDILQASAATVRRIPVVRAFLTAPGLFRVYFANALARAFLQLTFWLPTKLSTLTAIARSMSVALQYSDSRIFANASLIRRIASRWRT